MPIDVTSTQDASITLEEFIDAVIPLATNLGDDDVLCSLAPKIIQLANNKSFLGDLLIGYLDSISGGATPQIGVHFEPYTSHVVLLHLDRVHAFLIRAAIWPAPNDYAYKINSDRAFSYNYPHDHNFSFLTVGYAGPGYESDYYEIEPDSILGLEGETVDLRFVGRTQLHRGRSLVYRAHRDIHVQYPPEELSVSLNLMGSGLRSSVTDQYIFDVQEQRIVKTVTPSATNVLISLAARLGGDAGRDYVSYVSQKHPVDSTRYQALKALAKADSGYDRMVFLSRHANEGPTYFREAARREMEKLNARSVGGDGRQS